MIPEHHVSYHTPVLSGEREPPYDCDRLLAEFDGHNVTYELFDHQPIFRVEDALSLNHTITGLDVKNLFVRDKKRTPFLITVLSGRQVDLKALRHAIGASGNLSFGHESLLWEHLGVRPGSVNPFCIINDTNHKVTPIVDTGLFREPMFNAHPLRNDKSVAILGDDLKRLYTVWGKNPLFIDFDNFEK